MNDKGEADERKPLLHMRNTVPHGLIGSFGQWLIKGTVEVPKCKWTIPWEIRHLNVKHWS